MLVDLFFEEDCGLEEAI